MELYRIEYIRKNGRSKGKKRGVLYCGVDPYDPDSVVVGFSLCNPIDRFDYTKDVRRPGLGLEIAKARGEKWKNHDNYFVQNSFTQEIFLDATVNLIYLINPDPEQIVEVPPSVVKQLRTFIGRCKKYYKNKDFPVWINKLEKDEPLEVQPAPPSGNALELADEDIEGLR